jgi:hypothetical protein
VSGYIQVEYGFGPVFALVIVLYVIAVWLYWKFFWVQEGVVEAVPAAMD